MTFRPKSVSKKEKIVAVLCAVFSIVLFAVSGIVPTLVVLYQISAFLLAVVSIEIYIKYVASDYIYEACDDCFKVYKVTGKRSICVSSLDYEMSLSQVVSNVEYDEEKERFPRSNFNVNFCKNLAPQSYYVYFFEFNGKKSMMKFEPDSVFADYINDKIAQAWEKSESQDEEDN